MDLPQNTRMQLIYEQGHQTLVIPHHKSGLIKYTVILFAFFLLCAWAFGWFTAFSDLFLREAGEKGFWREGNVFMLFWLCGWTIAGVVVAFFVYRSLRKSIPEKWIFSSNGLYVDTGLPSFPPIPYFGGRYDPFYVFKSICKKREQFTFTKTDLMTLKLRDTSQGNRLSIDQGAKRIDLAIGATEVEREWAYKYLCQQFSLTGVEKS